jgi:multisubunit Na+/H+ antiporter MnhE subunit
MAIMALACTINLTPGTVFVELEDGKLGVHAIDAKFLVGMEDKWRVVKKLREIEGGH